MAESLMQIDNDILYKLSPHIFWDVDIKKIDIKRDKKFIIGRIANYGFETDEILLHKMYPYRVLRKIIKELDNLNESAIPYLSLVFNIKERAFKCYGKKPSHMNY